MSRFNRLALLSNVVIALALAGCGGGGGGGSGSPPAPPTQTQTYTVGATVTGLSGTLVLRLNGASDLSVSAPGSFTFTASLASGASYAVTIGTQPATQTCAVTAGSGAIGAANVTNVAVSCTTNVYTIGGTSSGLGGTVVLQNNGGNNLALSGNGSFTFSTAVSSGSAYNVTVLTQPAGQTCVVTNGSGNAAANVTNVAVSCSSNVYTIGGILSGLNGTVVLQNNGANNLSLSAGGNFAFGAPVVSGGAYNVTVLTQPVGQTCVVTSGSGNALANVSNIAVACTTNTYSISGTVSGLTGSVVLQNNAGNNLSLAANGGFTFTTRVAHAAAYNVTILTQPAGQTCVVSNGAGNAVANVINVAVACTTNTYSISGTLSGLFGTVVLQNNSGNNLSLTANGNFTFGTLPSGSSYNVTVLTQPANQTCSVSNGSGTVAANVSVAVNCVYPQLVANGQSLIVTTANFIATFAGADLVGLQNRLTGESYLRNPSAGQLAMVNTAQPTGQSLPTSNWTVAPESGTGTPLATIAASDSARALTLKVKIDAATQEIIIKASATVSTPGLRDASWSIAGLDFAAGRLLVPAFTGEVFDAKHLPSASYLTYPSTWHAQMFVYEAPQGSFLAYSTDTQFRFKDLRGSTRGHNTVDLAVAAEAQAPFATATSVPEIEWRLKAFAGGWRTAAQVYKDWLASNRPPVSNAAHPWVQNIRTVIGVRIFDDSELIPLASQFVPSETLLYVANWRADPYDNNYPDYTPQGSVASFVTKAHALGFKVMLHFNFVGVSDYNPQFASLASFQVKTADTLQPLGWMWECAACLNRFAYISPASSAYRALLISRIGAAVNALHPDALHLDQTVMMNNDGNGLIEGMTYNQGSVRLHQDLVAAFPSLALGGEGENDVVYGYQSFAQNWFTGNDEFYGHPIASFLFSPQVQYYGHLGQPFATDPTFKDYLSSLEHRAVTPSISINTAGDLDTNVRDNARLINLLQVWQNGAFQPDWANSSWGNSLVHYAGTGGQTAALNDSGTLESLTAGAATPYQLSHDVNRLTTTSYVPSWPAFDASTLFGLDPTKKYWLELLPRPQTTHITSLPVGGLLGANTLVTSKFALFEVGASASSQFDFSNLLSATLGVRYQGAEWPLAYGAVAFPSTITVGNVTRPGVFMHPPWQNQIGGETFVEYSVPVGGAGGQFRFAVGLQDGSNCNVDGATFRVVINNVEVYRQTYSPGAWHDGFVDLAPYASSTIVMRLVTNPGPQGNASCDGSGWSQLGIASPPSSTPLISVPIALDPGAVFSGLAGDGSYSPGTVSNLPVPGRFVLFTQPGSVVANGTNLASLPFDVSYGPHGELAASGALFNAGQPITGTVGGVSKPAIGAHPPDGGRTILSWTLNVPPAPNANKLSWAAGLDDNSASDDGVDFSVWIDGVPYWQLTKSNGAWSSASLDLQRWQGQNVVVQLVTDSRANYVSDHAEWGDLLLSASSATCNYSVPAPAQATVAAAGGAASLSVTAPATCPWAVSSSVPWVTINSGGSSNGNGTINYTVAPNASAPRSGNLVVGGQTFVIKQADANGVFPP